VFVFGKSGENWTQIRMLQFHRFGTGFGPRFGGSVAISPDYIAVGAPWDNVAGSFAGAAYIYNLVDATTSVQDAETVPVEYALDQNFPNPFNPSTNIRFSLPAASTVRVEVFNILGQTVAVLQEGDLEAGYHTVQWNAQVATGLYFYRIEATSASDPNVTFRAVKKMMLVK